MKNNFLILVFVSFCFSFISCEKKPAVPALTTNDVTEITQTTATSGGSVTEGESQVTSSGICWSSSEKPTVADKISADAGTGSPFIRKLTDLVPNTKYYVRAYATNANGTGYGNQVIFTTSQIAVPEITTREIDQLTSFTSYASGIIISDNGSPITEKGVCLGKSHNPTTSDLKFPCFDTQGVSDIFTSYLPWETPNTTYYLRAYAINSAGTGYGNEITFTIPDYPLLFNPAITYGTLSDPDNNTYKTVTIGTQVWMAENLRTTKLSDGTPVPLVSDHDQWGNLTTPGYCYFNNDEGYKLIFGALYNYYAVSTGLLCPAGWHVPSMAEITTLQINLGGEALAGGKMKETGITHWKNPNETATNESGFTALPANLRGDDGFFPFIDGEGTGWWLSDSPDSYLFGAVNNSAILQNYGYAVAKRTGFAVRCLKN
jgi:uncharacterized protein (TIGR02145 family)